MFKIGKIRETESYAKMRGITPREYSVYESPKLPDLLWVSDGKEMEVVSRQRFGNMVKQEMIEDVEEADYSDLIEVLAGISEEIPVVPAQALGELMESGQLKLTGDISSIRLDVDGKTLIPITALIALIESGDVEYTVET